MNEILTGFIIDCVGNQILQSVPVLASVSHGGLNFESIATEAATALIGGVLLAIAPGLFTRLRPTRMKGETRRGA